MNWSSEYRGVDSLYGESIYTSRFEIFGKYEFNSKFSFSFSFNDHNHNSFYGLTPFNADQSIGFGQFIWNENMKRHDILFGIAYRYTYYDDDTTATFNELTTLNSPTNTQLPGIFIQDEIKLNSKNNLLLGFRYDYNSTHGNVFTPRINYKTTNQDKSATFRLSLGSGYRVAQVFTEDHAALTGARDVVFLEDLDPERSWNINANFLKKLYFKQGAIIDFDISIFYTQFSNKIIPDYETDPNKIIYTNLYGESINQGASLNLNLLIQNGIRVNLGATYIDSFIDQNNLKKRPYLTEKFQGVWKLGKKWKSSNLSLDLTGSVIGPLLLPTLGPLDPRASYSPAFHIVNIQLTKSWNNIFETYCGVKNLLDFTPSAESIARSFDPFDNGVSFDVEGNALSTQNNPFALTFDPSYVYASNQGVRFFFGLRWKLN
jgi:outer membrane receptor for ferrienterochelin and colicins